MFSFSEDEIYTLVVSAYKNDNLTLRDIANIYGEKISYGDIQRIIKYKKFPKDPQKRAALQLAPVVEVNACSQCGKAHVSKKCTERPKSYKDLFSIPTDVLKWMIENRKEFD